MAYVVANGMLFAQDVEGGGQLALCGKDVRAGEADKPLCWWKDKRAATYRVVFGDLTVRMSFPPKCRRSKGHDWGSSASSVSVSAGRAWARPCGQYCRSTPLTGSAISELVQCAVRHGG